MRRLIFALLVLLVAGSAGATGWFGWRVWGDHADNRAIRDLAAGRAAEPRDGADPRVAYARILFLAWRDRIPEAEALVPALSGAAPALQSGARMTIANARMRRGYDALEARDLDGAMAEVNLAKSAYRDALRADPGNFDAKVNLELATRLFRDLPREGNDGEENPDIKPSELWTDLPGLPRGAP